MAEYTSEMTGNGQFGVCAHCKKLPTKEGHDGCLGTLPNMMNACCGHGDDSKAYIQYWTKHDVIRGEYAVREQTALKRTGNGN